MNFQQELKNIATSLNELDTEQARLLDSLIRTHAQRRSLLKSMIEDCAESEQMKFLKENTAKRKEIVRDFVLNHHEQVKFTRQVIDIVTSQ